MPHVAHLKALAASVTLLNVRRSPVRRHVAITGFSANLFPRLHELGSRRRRLVIARGALVRTLSQLLTISFPFLYHEEVVVPNLG